MPQVLLLLGALSVWGQYVVARRQLTTRVMVLAAIEEACIIACGVLLHVRVLLATAHCDRM